MIKPTTKQLKAYRFRDDGLGSTPMELEVLTNTGYRFAIGINVEGQCLMRNSAGAYLWAVPGGGFATLADIHHFERYGTMPAQAWEMDRD